MAVVYEYVICPAQVDGLTLPSAEHVSFFTVLLDISLDCLCCSMLLQRLRSWSSVHYARVDASCLSTDSLAIPWLMMLLKEAGVGERLLRFVSTTQSR